MYKKVSETKTEVFYWDTETHEHFKTDKKGWRIKGGE